MTIDKSKAHARSSDTHEALLAAAKHIFSVRGFDAATVKDLADEAGVNVSLISYHFGGKEGLYKACLEDFGRHRLQAAERMLKHAESAAEFELRLQLFADEFVESQLRDKEVCTIVHRDFDAGNAIALAVFKDIFIKIFDRFSEFLNAAKQIGFLRADVDVEASATLMFGGLVHLMRSDPVRRDITGQTIEDPVFRSRMVHAFSSNAVRGLIAATPTGGSTT